MKSFSPKNSKLKSTTKSTNKVKNILKQIICRCCFYLTHIFEVSRFDVLISRFFWAFFSKPPDLHVMGVGRSAKGHCKGYTLPVVSSYLCPTIRPQVIPLHPQVIPYNAVAKPHRDSLGSPSGLNEISAFY